MNRQASILFNFIDSSFSGNSLALQGTSVQQTYYQRLICSLLSHSIYTAEGFHSLGKQLADIAQHAYLLRQIETVDQASQIMLALPISNQLKGIAHYYQAICAKREGYFDNALRLLERASEEVPQQYRPRVLLTTGATYHARGEVDVALPLYVAAGKAAIDCDLLTLIESQRDVAVICSIRGDHKQALEDIEHLFPLVRVIARRYPELYYSFLNSLAVELGEVSRIDEAQAICRVTIASPFATAYPEFAQTRNELQAKRTSATPSIVAVSFTPDPTPSPRPARKLKHARLLVVIRPAREKAFIQISIAIALAAVARIEISPTFLDRARHCIYPRGPPSPLRS